MRTPKLGTAMMILGLGIFFFGLFSFSSGSSFSGAPSYHYEIPAKIGIAGGASLVLWGLLIYRKAKSWDR